jgi:hypothetical protein
VVNRRLFENFLLGTVGLKCLAASEQMATGASWITQTGAASLRVAHGRLQRLTPALAVKFQEQIMLPGIADYCTVIPALRRNSRERAFFQNMLREQPQRPCQDMNQI